MWIFDANGWKNITDEQFLAMTQKANGIKPQKEEPAPEVDIEVEKPKVRKPRTKKAKA